MRINLELARPLTDSEEGILLDKLNSLLYSKGYDDYDAQFGGIERDGTKYSSKTGWFNLNQLNFEYCQISFKDAIVTVDDDCEDLYIDFTLMFRGEGDDGEEYEINLGDYLIKFY